MIEHLEQYAVINVDPQNDFCPGGSLAVNKGDEIMSQLSRVNKKVWQQGGEIIATRDWHPINSRHFSEFGGIWPAHCVQDQRGAKFHSELWLPKEVEIFSKGTRVEEEAYSGFDGQNNQHQSLEQFLKTCQKSKVLVGGLATDYCVKATVLDALKLGFQTYLIQDAIRAVNLQPDDGKKALTEMVQAGANLVNSWEI